MKKVNLSEVRGHLAHFAVRIAKARRDLRAGLGIPLEEVMAQLENGSDPSPLH